MTASGTNTSGIEAVSGGTVTLSGASITSSRLNGEGVDINSGGHVTMTGGSVTTSGNGSAEGFAVNGTGSTLEASGISVTTNGTTDPASGLYVIGLTVNSGSATFAGGSITTNGPSGIGASAIAYPDGPGRRKHFDFRWHGDCDERARRARTECRWGHRALCPPMGSV